MREYFSRPDATAEALQDGWLHTGDLGRLDADGRLFITGRKKEIIVLSSGKNLYPEEIEAHYRQSAFIKELARAGPERGRANPPPSGCTRSSCPTKQALRERGIVNLRELVRFEVEGLSVQLPAHKRILTYDISLEPLPRTTTGKIRRHEIERPRARTRRDDAPRRGRERRRPRLAGRSRRTPTLRCRSSANASAARSCRDANLELDLGLDSMERVELLTALGTAARHARPGRRPGRRFSRCDNSWTPCSRRPRGRRREHRRRTATSRGTRCWPRRRIRRSSRTCRGPSP